MDPDLLTQRPDLCMPLATSCVACGTVPPDLLLRLRSHENFWQRPEALAEESMKGFMARVSSVVRFA